MGEIELYDRQDCPYSKRVRETLDTLGVEYEETIVPDAHSERTDVQARTGQSGVPVLFDDRLDDGYLADSSEIVRHLERTYG
jgi:glutaredoxin